MLKHLFNLQHKNETIYKIHWIDFGNGNINDNITIIVD